MTRFASQGLCPTKRGPDTKGTKPQPKKHKEESSLGFLVPFCDPHCASCGSFPFCWAKPPLAVSTATQVPWHWGAKYYSCGEGGTRVQRSHASSCTAV